MIRSLKTLILVGFASLLLVACGQGGGGAGSKKSKTLENTKKAGFVKCGVSEGVPGFSNADASALEKPGRPCETPHFTNPAFLVFSRVLDFFEPAPPPPWPQATKSKEANPTKIQVLIDLII